MEWALILPIVLSDFACNICCLCLWGFRGLVCSLGRGGLVFSRPSFHALVLCIWYMLVGQRSLLVCASCRVLPL